MQKKHSNGLVNRSINKKTTYLKKILTIFVVAVFGFIVDGLRADVCVEEALADAHIEAAHSADHWPRALSVDRMLRLDQHPKQRPGKLP